MALHRKLEETCGTLYKTLGHMWHSIENLRKSAALYRKLKDNMRQSIENLRQHAALYRKLEETCGTL